MDGKKSFCELLEEAVNDEAEAQEFYDNLENELLKSTTIDAVDKYVFSAAIRKAKQEETRHEDLIKTMKERFCLHEK